MSGGTRGTVALPRGLDFGVGEERVGVEQCFDGPVEFPGGVEAIEAGLLAGLLAEKVRDGGEGPLWMGSDGVSIRLK